MQSGQPWLQLSITAQTWAQASAMLPPPVPPVPELVVAPVPPGPDELVDEAPAPPTPSPESMTALPPQLAAITTAIGAKKVKANRSLCMEVLKNGKVPMKGADERRQLRQKQTGAAAG